MDYTTLGIAAAIIVTGLFLFMKLSKLVMKLGLLIVGLLILAVVFREQLGF